MQDQLLRVFTRRTQFLQQDLLYLSLRYQRFLTYRDKNQIALIDLCAVGASTAQQKGIFAKIMTPAPVKRLEKRLTRPLYTCL